MDVVAVLLLDVTPAYLAAMLEEQPTLRGLFALGRLVPVFQDSPPRGGPRGAPLSCILRSARMVTGSTSNPTV